jgi:hypothetical protein
LPSMPAFNYKPVPYNGPSKDEVRELAHRAASWACGCAPLPLQRQVARRVTWRPVLARRAAQRPRGRPRRTEPPQQRGAGARSRRARRRPQRTRSPAPWQPRCQRAGRPRGAQALTLLLPPPHPPPPSRAPCPSTRSSRSARSSLAPVRPLARHPPGARARPRRRVQAGVGQRRQQAAGTVGGLPRALRSASRERSPTHQAFPTHPPPTPRTHPSHVLALQGARHDRRGQDAVPL